ncbi:helix-turn-helix domain-containing protein [Propionibacterium freudenreichii]|uniref:helix-turn-helix domain-containing protein n=1 Tax=Propionibacterium freudenreichii TaxID=1744 RepID=UPI0035D00012|nr:XRE family transcriptional regulator [Propionibacterium freudenreichii]
MNFDLAFGARVRDLREAASLTQEQVAERMGVAVSTVSRLDVLPRDVVNAG